MISARSISAGVVDAQGAALAADVVLRLVEAVGPQRADRAERLALVEGVDPLGRVLQHLQAVPGGDGHDVVHRAADPRVMDREDGPRPRRDGSLDGVLVDVQRVRADVHEDRPGPEADDGVGGGDERERRQDDLVAGPEVAEHGAISSAAVQDGVSSTLRMPKRSSSSRLHCCVKWPSPAMLP